MILGLTVMFDEEIVSRFLDKIEIDDQTGCWNWTAGKWGKGYGQFSVSGRPMSAHRFSYQHFVGEIPDGLDVLHSCDNPGCVNPEHLWLGTNEDNIADKVSKGRSGVGSDNPNAKITAETVLVIRELVGSGQVKQSEIADQLGLSRQGVSDIVNRKVWRNV
jgi:predicted XRE-type DNA-binding protein